MIRFLVFGTVAEAEVVNARLMNSRRKAGNTDGDGKAFVTQGRCVLRKAKDGTAVLIVTDASILLPLERAALTDELPVKFVRIFDDDGTEIVGARERRE